MTRILSAEQKQSYADQGFLVIPNFVEDYVCDALMQRAHELIQEFQPQQNKTIFTIICH